MADRIYTMVLAYRVSYLMEQGNINLVFTSFLNHDSPIAEHVKLHGDGVRDISLKVPNIDETGSFIGKTILLSLY